MPFKKEPAKAPAGIGRITVTLTDRPARPAEPGRPEEPASQTIMVTFDVVDAAGNRIADRHEDLAPNLTTAQANSLRGLLTSIRTKIASEVLT